MIFNLTPENGQIKWADSAGLSEWCYRNDGKHYVAEFQLAVTRSEKMKLYNFYHGVLLPIAIEELTKAGYEMVDKVFADFWLKNECAKGIKYNAIQDKEMIYLESKTLMSKERLTKFVTDCIHYIESTWHRQVPDSSQFKYGLIGFKSIKNER